MNLERRDLLTVISLLNGVEVGANAPSIDGFPTAPPPPRVVPPTALGVQFTTTANLSQVGSSVTIVGDVNGDGFDDFLVTTEVLEPETQQLTGQVSLVFGSRAADPAFTPTNFLSLINARGDETVSPPILPINERVADLVQLGNPVQDSPATGGPTFPFDGLTFTTGLTINDELGFAVAPLGDINGNGLADFAIGAPGALNNNGRVFIVYGSNQFNQIPDGQNVVDFDRPQDINPAVRFTVIDNTQLPGARFGSSIAGAGDVINDGFDDFAIGAPQANVGVGLVDNGATYLFNGARFRGATPPPVIDLSTFGTVGSTLGILFTGEATGSLAGFSVNRGGNFDGTAGGELLIGAPSQAGAQELNEGRAYVIYGSPTLLSQFTTLGVAPTVPLNALNTTANGLTVEGLVFAGEAPGDQAGFAVAPAGNYDGFGPDDILIGSPGFGPNQGRATLVLGGPRPAMAGRALPLTDLDPEIFRSTSFVGINPGDRAGVSLAGVRSVNTDNLPEILIGSPGFANGQGAAYLVAGTSQELPPVVNLVDVAAGAQGVPPGIQFVLERGAGALGASVSGVSPFSTRGATVDGDNRGDFLIGAPFDNPIFPGSGSAFLLQGGLVPLDTLPPGPPPPPPPPPPPGPLPGPVLPTVRFRFPGVNAAAPRYGESLVPTPEALSSGLNFYRPMPLGPAVYQQFLARPGFGQRFTNYFHPEAAVNRPGASQFSNRRDGTNTLPGNVFTRGRFRVGEIAGPINHGVPTIPLQNFRTANQGLFPNRAFHLNRGVGAGQAFGPPQLRLR